jgi:hypothetical protein
MTAAAAYFAARPAWVEYSAAAVLGVVSDYKGANEFMGQELLNLLARAGMNYRIVGKDRPDFTGLRALLYADKEAPTPALRKQAMDFVGAGGLLIAAPVWGAPGGKPEPGAHPRFSVTSVGKGRVAMALAEPDDPWLLANDSVLLVSHRYDLVRCFNSGSFASYYTQSAGGQKALVHLLFYSDRGPGEASVRVAGRYRSARISTVDQPDPKPTPAEFGKDWVEVHLPPVPPYVALELSV